MKLTHGHLGAALALSLPALASCTSEPVGPSAREVAETYADVLHATYDDAALGARELDVAVRAFTASPSPQALQLAREAWIASRPAYLESEVARFYDGPIDDPDTGPEPLINAWPLDEAYVDYVVDGAGAPLHGGIVNDPSILETVDPDGIAMLNQVDSEENVSTGYHAIEFLLWGQDLRADGPGDRPHTDYVEGMAMNVARRRAYLEAVSTMLEGHLETVRDAWAPGATYRTEMLGAADTDPTDALGRILRGMGSLSGAELAGERMDVAYMTKEQEDEHSCFSDTTTQDQLHDAIGIRNVYLGRYERSDGTIVAGPSLSELVAARDPALDARMREQLDASVTAIGAIPGPFDQAILGADDAPGRVAIRAAIDALRAQTRTTADIAALLGVTLNLED